MACGQRRGDGAADRVADDDDPSGAGAELLPEVGDEVLEDLGVSQNDRLTRLDLRAAAVARPVDGNNGYACSFCRVEQGLPRHVEVDRGVAATR